MHLDLLINDKVILVSHYKQKTTYRIFLWQIFASLMAQKGNIVSVPFHCFSWLTKLAWESWKPVCFFFFFGIDQKTPVKMWANSLSGGQVALGWFILICGQNFTRLMRCTLSDAQDFEIYFMWQSGKCVSPNWKGSSKACYLRFDITPFAHSLH